MQSVTSGSCKVHQAYALVQVELICSLIKTHTVLQGVTDVSRAMLLSKPILNSIIIWSFQAFAYSVATVSLLLREQTFRHVIQDKFRIFSNLGFVTVIP